MAASISQYVLKVHSRCNLACNHCYVYEHADQSWRTKPRVISSQTVAMAANRIREHAIAHRLADVFVVLHGGEPLLVGKTRMRALLDVLISQVGPVTGLDLRIHSNGLLLDEQWCAMFREHGVKIGVSLDGDRAANDRHRVFADGRGSYDQVHDALTLLRRPENRHLYAGILCTIDLASDPVAVYQALAAQEPPNLDLLLPHATWERPPYRPAGLRSPYADWLMQVYRCWDQDSRRIPIRIFNSVLSTARGGPSLTEALGTEPGDLLVIDTNGDWEQPDSMKTAFDGAATTGMNVFRHAVEEVAAHPAIMARRGGVPALCATCRGCPVVRVCGGGLYAHRFRAGPHARRRSGTDPAEFDHPSVYCDDLKALIDAVVAADRSPAARAVARPAAASVSDEPGPPGTRPAHVLPGGAFDILAAGPGDVASVEALADVRMSQVRSLVAVVAASTASWRDSDLRAAAGEGWALLSTLSRHHPGEVNEVLAHPYAFAWALRCLRPPPGADTDLDRAHLASLAAAAAFRAGIPAELAAPVRDGYVHLPTVGAIAADPGPGRTQVVTVTPGQPPTPRGGGLWRTARYVNDPPFRRLIVEDLDPFRDCQQWPAAGRLSLSEWQAWRRDLAAAGQHLAATVPGYAQALAAGLRVVVPLRPAAASSRSASAWQAFGGVAIARPGDHAPHGELSELLLHEFQHVKLNVLLDLHELTQAGSPVRFRVPWRRDEPRPPEAALHGIYAFLALTHLRRAEGRAARATYLRYRSWVCGVADDLLRASGVLTSAGERFVSGMAVAAEDAVT